MAHRISPESGKKVIALYSHHTDLIRKDLDAFESAVVNNDPKRQRSTLDELASKTAFLFDQIAPSERPSWLVTLKEQTGRLQTHIASFKGLEVSHVRSIFNVRDQIRSHKWYWDDDEEVRIDLLMEQAIEESGFGKAFSDLIDELEKIITSGEIEDEDIESELRRLLQLLESNQSGKQWGRMTWAAYYAGEVILAMFWVMSGVDAGEAVMLVGLKKSVDLAMEKAKDMIDTSRKKLKEEAKEKVSEIKAIENLQLRGRVADLERELRALKAPES